MERIEDIAHMTNEQEYLMRLIDSGLNEEQAMAVIEEQKNKEYEQWCEEVAFAHVKE